MPGGAPRRMELFTELICAIAPPMSVPGWKYTFSMPMLGSDWDSMREMPLTVVE